MKVKCCECGQDSYPFELCDFEEVLEGEGFRLDYICCGCSQKVLVYLNVKKENRNENAEFELSQMREGDQF